MTVPEEYVSIESYNLCELENSNLRKQLAWAATHLIHEQKLELKAQIEKSLDQGGVTKDASDDRFEEIQEIKRLCVKAADMFREITTFDGPELLDQLDKINWYARADDLAGKLMEFDPPTEEANLAVIRNTKAIE